jgi:hypothetical protein
MNRERWRRVEEIFESALYMPPEQRESFLAENCGDDIELYSQVAAMLAADETKFSGCGRRRIGRGCFARSKGRPRPEHRKKSRKIQNRREIGRGGMGAVYEAVRDDAEFYQRVAIKLIRRGMDTDFILRRFRHERQILANLNHPNSRAFSTAARLRRLAVFRDGIRRRFARHQFCEQNN